MTEEDRRAELIKELTRMNEAFKSEGLAHLAWSDREIAEMAEALRSGELAQAELEKELAESGKGSENDDARLKEEKEFAEWEEAIRIGDLDRLDEEIAKWKEKLRKGEVTRGAFYSAMQGLYEAQDRIFQEDRAIWDYHRKLHSVGPMINLKTGEIGSGSRRSMLDRDTGKYVPGRRIGIGLFPRPRKR